MAKAVDAETLTTRFQRIGLLSYSAHQVLYDLQTRSALPFPITNLRDEFDQHQRKFSVDTLGSFATAFEARASGVVYAVNKSTSAREMDAEVHDLFSNLAKIARQIVIDCRTIFRAPDDMPSAPINLVPPQQPAPIRVAVRQNRIVIDNKNTNEGILNASNINRIRGAALESLNLAVGDIKQSQNTDQRILPVLKNLSKHLRANIADLSPEALGLNAQIVGRIVSQQKEEMPSFALIQIEESLSAIQVVLSQFEEWRLFKIAEAASNTTYEEAKMLYAQAIELANDLAENKPHSEIDNRILERLREIIDPLRAAAVDYDMMVAPLYASFNNIFAGLLDALLHIAHSDASLHGSHLALATIAYAYLRKFAEPLDRFPPLRFVKTSLEWVEKYSSTVRNLQ